jgi:hypothetical protein
MLRSPNNKGARGVCTVNVDKRLTQHTCPREAVLHHGGAIVLHTDAFLPVLPGPMCLVAMQAQASHACTSI